MISRLRAIDRRLLMFGLIGVALILLAMFGVLDSRRDVRIEQQQAVEIARPHIDFEPEKADARLIRQGFRRTPVWAVSFSIPIDGNPRDFERLMTVEVDATTGEVIRIATDGGDGTANG